MIAQKRSHKPRLKVKKRKCRGNQKRKERGATDFEVIVQKRSYKPRLKVQKRRCRGDQN